MSKITTKSFARGSMSYTAWLCLLPWTITMYFVKCFIRLEIFIAKSIILFFFPDLREQLQNSKNIMTNAV